MDLKHGYDPYTCSSLAFHENVKKGFRVNPLLANSQSLLDSPWAILKGYRKSAGKYPNETEEMFLFAAL